MTLKTAGVAIVVLSLSTMFYDIPDHITSILTFVWILIVPYLVGSLFLKIPSKQIGKIYLNLLTAGTAGLVVRWFIGLLLITMVMYVSFVIQQGIANILGPLLLIVTVAYGLTWKSSELALHQKLVFGIKNNHYRVIIPLILIGICFAFYLRSFTPYPLSPGFDVFTHMFVTTSILNDSFSSIPLVYFPTWDIILALGSTTFNADLNSIFWMGSFFLHILFSLSCYVLVYYFSKNQAIAVIGTIISLPLTEQGFSPNLQVLYPSSFVMCIFPVMFFVLDYLWKKVDNVVYKVTSILIVFVGMVFIHPLLGMTSSLMLSIYLVCAYHIAKKSRVFLVLRLSSIIFSMVLIGYYFNFFTIQFYSADIFSGNLFGSEHLYQVPTKIMHLEQWYSKEIMTLSIFGFLMLSFHRNKKIVSINFIAIILLLIYFQQISYVHRIMILERALLTFSASMVLILPLMIIIDRLKIHYLSNKRGRELLRNKDLLVSTNVTGSIEKSGLSRFKFAITKNGLGLIPSFEKSPFILVIYVPVLFLILFPVLMTPIDIYVDSYLAGGYYFSSYTHDELAASNWIDQNIPSNFKIYSDPQTVIEMRGLANRLNIDAIGWNTTVAQEVKSVFQSESPSYAYQHFLSKYGKDIAIVISPRTAEWINGNNFFITLPVTDFKYFDGLVKFFSESYFNLDYYKNDIFVFTLR